jgi:hypothetical protein
MSVVWNGLTMVTWDIDLRLGIFSGEVYFSLPIISWSVLQSLLSWFWNGLGLQKASPLAGLSVGATHQAAFRCLHLIQRAGIRQLRLGFAEALPQYISIYLNTSQSQYLPKNLLQDPKLWEVPVYARA